MHGKRTRHGICIISDLLFFLFFFSFFFRAKLLIVSINNLGLVALINLTRVGHAYLSTTYYPLFTLLIAASISRNS